MRTLVEQLVSDLRYEDLRIHDESMRALQAPEVQLAMSRQGLEVETSTPEALATRIKSETATWAEVVKAAGIKAE